MSKTSIKNLAAVLGFFGGGVIGVFGAPAWEMAELFVGPIGGVAGASAAYATASSAKGIVPAAIAVAACVLVIVLLSLGNPPEVTIHCMVVVLVAGTTAGVVGHALGKIPAPH